VNTKWSYMTFTKSLLMTIFLMLFIAPFIIILMNSFKAKTEIISNPLSLPNSLKLTNYIEAFERMDYVYAFANSLTITVCSVLLIALFSSMTAHYFVRNKSKFNMYAFFLMVASMIIPFQAIMIPLVKIYGSLELLNSKWALVYMYVGFGSSLAVFIYHGFIKSIPKELEEAALIDGCSRTQTFFKIVFPILMPTTVTVFILNVLWIWNDFLLPFLVLITPTERTLPLATYSFYGTYSAEYGLVMAGLVLTIFPVILVYFFAQKYIIQGVMQGSIK